VAKDGQVKGVTVGSGVGASDGATVSLGDEAAAMIDGVAAGRARRLCRLPPRLPTRVSRKGPRRLRPHQSPPWRLRPAHQQTAFPPRRPANRVRGAARRRGGQDCVTDSLARTARLRIRDRPNRRDRARAAAAIHPPNMCSVRHLPSGNPANCGHQVKSTVPKRGAAPGR